MPQLDGISIAAFASFAGLIVAWLAAPSTTVAAIEHQTAPLPASAAA